MTIEELSAEIIQRRGEIDDRTNESGTHTVWHIHFGADADLTGFRFSSLKVFEQLEWLLFFGQKTVDDDRLLEMLPIPSVRHLRLAGSSVTDIGINHIGILAPKLELLDVSDSAVSDLAIENILSLGFLEVLDISWTSMSADGIRQLLENAKSLGEMWARGFSIEDIRHLDSCWKFEGDVCKFVRVSGV